MTEAYRTWEQLSELEQLECEYCEAYKDVHGIKARWYRAESVEQARKDLEALYAEAQVVLAREEQERAAALVRFKKRVQETIAAGAGDLATALRWIHDAEGTTGDDCFLEYNLGLAYGAIATMVGEDVVLSGV